MNDKDYQSQAFNYFGDVYGYPVYLDSFGRVLVPLKKKLHSDNWQSCVFNDESEARKTLSLAKSRVPVSKALTVGGLVLLIMAVRLGNTSEEMCLLPILLVVQGLLLVNFGSSIDSHRLSKACENIKQVNVRDITPKFFSNFVVVVCGLLALFLIYAWLYLWINYSIPIRLLVFITIIFIGSKSLEIFGFTPFEKTFVCTSEKT